MEKAATPTNGIIKSFDNKSIGYIDLFEPVNYLISFHKSNCLNGYLPKIGDIVHFELLGNNIATKVQLLAQYLIEEEKKSKSEVLNLNNCKLVEWPEELFELIWLKVLIIGQKNKWNGNNIVEDTDQVNRFANKLNSLDPRLSNLKNLTHLILDNNNIQKTSDLEPLTNIIHLNLSFNSIENIENISRLNSLKILILSFNKLTNANGVAGLNNLETLYLNNNLIKSTNDLKNLPKLTTLYISSNPIEDNSKLEYFPKLSKLTVSNCGLNNMVIIKNLTSLTELTITHNNISKIEYLQGLSNLKYLSLESNKIKVIDGLENLKSLERLHLENNEIEKVEGLDKLEKLILLHLENNKISKIEGLDNLISLKELDLPRNNIQKIEGLNNLKSLTWLNLHINKIQSVDGIESLYDKPNLKTLIIKENPFTLDASWFTEEVVLSIGENKEDIFKYIKDYKSNLFDLKFKLPYKIILLGNSEDGKTSLAYKLSKRSHTVNKEKSTHGLKIRKWKLPEYQEALIYDFGGQDFYHSIYNMYFTVNTLFILLWDSDRLENKFINQSKLKSYNLSEKEKYIAYNREYWLGNLWYWNYKNKVGIINQESGLENESKFSVITVQNIFNSSHVQYFHEKSFSPTIYFQSSINLKTKFNERINNLKFNLLKSIIIDELNHLNINTPRFNLYDISITKEILKSKGHEAISISNFNELYPNHSSHLLPILHNRGLVLHYINNKDLKDYIWLNPESVSKEINRILSKKTLLGVGKINVSKFQASEGLIKLMIHQEIIFINSSNGTNEYIIPNYLPNADKEDILLSLATEDFKDGFSVKFYNYMPHGLMTRLICRLGNNPGIKDFYKDLLIFVLDQKNGNRAKILIQIDYIGLKIDVKVQTSDKNQSDIFEYLFYCILISYWNQPHIEFKDYFETNARLLTFENDNVTETPVKSNSIIPLESLVIMPLKLSLDNEYYIDYHTEFTKNGNQRNFLNASSEAGASKELPISLFNPFLSEKIRKPIPKKLFISYSSKDSAYMQRFIIHLDALKREGLISPWVDRMIETGTSWDDTIRQQMESADMFIYLLSPNFLATSYIIDIELPKGIQLAEENKAKIEFVQLKPNGWKRIPVMCRLQQLNRPDAEEKELVFIDHPENDEGWMKVIEDIVRRI